MLLMISIDSKGFSSNSSLILKDNVRTQTVRSD